MPVVTIDGDNASASSEGFHPRRAVRVIVSGSSLGGHSEGIYSAGSVTDLPIHEGCSRGSSGDACSSSSVHRVPSLGLLLGGASLAGSDSIAVSAGELLVHTPLGLASSATLTRFAPLCSPIEAGPQKTAPTEASVGQGPATGDARTAKPAAARESGGHRQRDGIAEIVPGVLYLCAAQALLTPTATASRAEGGQAAETPSDHAGPAVALTPSAAEAESSEKWPWPHGISALLCAADEVDEHRIAALRGCGVRGGEGEKASVDTGDFYAGFASTLCEPAESAIPAPSPRGAVASSSPTGDTTRNDGRRIRTRSQLSSNAPGSGEYSDMPSLSSGLMDDASFAGCASNGARCGPTSPSAAYYRSALSEGGSGAAAATARMPSAPPLHSLLPLSPAVLAPPTVAAGTHRTNAPFVHDTLRLLHLPLRDATDSALPAYLEEACWFIDLCRAEGRRVVVFCREGRSRSSSVVIAYLMRTMGLSFEAALAHVRRRRPAVDPNIAFCAQLQKWGCEECQEKGEERHINILTSVDGCMTAATLQRAMQKLPLLPTIVGQKTTQAARTSPLRTSADRSEASSLSGSTCVET